MSRDDRRASLIDATVPLIRRYGRSVTTRQIASAAGVAEGTIFRVFDTKDDLLDAALRAALDPAPLIAAVRAIPLDDDLRTRLVAVATVTQDRFFDVFDLMRTMEVIGPPPGRADPQAGWRQELDAALRRVVEGDDDRLRVPPERLLHYVRLLTFSGSHELIANGDLLTPDEIVDVILTGTLAGSPPIRGPRETEGR